MVACGPLIDDRLKRDIWTGHQPQGHQGINRSRSIANARRPAAPPDEMRPMTSQ
jgi:hypothetical protein